VTDLFERIRALERPAEEESTKMGDDGERNTASFSIRFLHVRQDDDNTTTVNGFQAEVEVGHGEEMRLRFDAIDEKLDRVRRRLRRNG
jgi:hypothetical protein